MAGTVANRDMLIRCTQRLFGFLDMAKVEATQAPTTGTQT